MPVYKIPSPSNHIADEFARACLGLNGGLYPRFVRYDGLVWQRSATGYTSTDSTATMTHKRAMRLIGDRRAEAVNAEVVTQ